MTSASFFAIKKLRGTDILRRAASHNTRRWIGAKASDGGEDAVAAGDIRLHVGSAYPAEIEQMAQRLLEEAGIRSLRKDAVRGVELLISLPPKPDLAIDQARYFQSALAWVKRQFPVPILSVIEHRDESAPHIHVLLLPLLKGRMRGSDLAGNRGRLRALQASFAREVAVPLGLQPHKPRSKISTVDRRRAASAVVDYLVDHPQTLEQPPVRDALRDVIGQDPFALLTILSLPLPEPPSKLPKRFVEIMTAPGRSKE